jgi:hypothetical protein
MFGREKSGNIDTYAYFKMNEGVLESQGVRGRYGRE